MGIDITKTELKMRGRKLKQEGRKLKGIEECFNLLAKLKRKQKEIKQKINPLCWSGF